MGEGWVAPVPPRGLKVELEEEAAAAALPRVRPIRCEPPEPEVGGAVINAA